MVQRIGGRIYRGRVERFLVVLVIFLVEVTVIGKIMKLLIIAGLRFFFLVRINSLRGVAIFGGRSVAQDLLEIGVFEHQGLGEVLIIAVVIGSAEGLTAVVDEVIIIEIIARARGARLANLVIKRVLAKAARVIGGRLGRRVMQPKINLGGLHEIKRKLTGSDAIAVFKHLILDPISVDITAVGAVEVIERNLPG